MMDEETLEELEDAGETEKTETITSGYYDTALVLLKTSLGVTHTARDDLFSKKLESSDLELARKGVDLDLSVVDDLMLLVDFTEWQYRNRDTEKSLPMSLTLRINNRKVKGRAENGS